MSSLKVLRSLGGLHDRLFQLWWMVRGGVMSVLATWCFVLCALAGANAVAYWGDPVPAFGVMWACAAGGLFLLGLTLTHHYGVSFGEWPKKVARGIAGIIFCLIGASLVTFLIFVQSPDGQRYFKAAIYVIDMRMMEHRLDAVIRSMEGIDLLPVDPALPEYGEGWCPEEGKFNCVRVVPSYEEPMGFPEGSEQKTTTEIQSRADPPGRLDFFDNACVEEAIVA